MSTLKTHRLEVGYLVVGLVFLGIALSWALREADVISADGVQWLLPATLVVAGGAGLAASLARTLREDVREPLPEPVPSGVRYDDAEGAAYDPPAEGPRDGGTNDDTAVIRTEPDER